MVPPYHRNITDDIRSGLLINLGALSYHCPSDSVFFYELPSSIGSSPHPCHWVRMVAMYGDKFGAHTRVRNKEIIKSYNLSNPGECPDKMSCIDAVWESWFTKYHQDGNLYTLYPAHQVSREKERVLNCEIKLQIIGCICG